MPMRCTYLTSKRMQLSAHIHRFVHVSWTIPAHLTQVCARFEAERAQAELEHEEAFGEQVRSLSMRGLSKSRCGCETCETNLYEQRKKEN
eukprot:scaffold93392_cov15-Tisochrysis_lutea.AAC.1